MHGVHYVLHGHPEDPRLLLSEPFRAVHYVYGLVHPEIPALPGRAILGSLAALGFGDEAARGILLRLRRSGFLESRRVGRTAEYALSSTSIGLLAEITRRATQDPPPWDGAFDVLVVEVPVSQRAFRERVRRHAAYAGFGMLRPGLLIAPYPGSRSALQPLLDRVPRGARVVPARLELALGDAAALAPAAWDLEAIAGTLRREADRMAAAADAAVQDPPTGADALRLLWRAIGPFFAILSANPPLPAELLPPDWPRAMAHAAFLRLAAVIAPPASRFVAELAAGAQPLAARCAPRPPSTRAVIPHTASPSIG